MKRFRPHKYKSKGQIINQKTQKMIEEQVEKSAFFEAVINRIEMQFNPKHLELFFQHLETSNQNAKRRKVMGSNENQSTLVEIKRESQCFHSFQQTQQTPFRKLDTAIFQNFEKRLFPMRTIMDNHVERKFLSTPKHHKNDEKLVLQKRLFEVDAKMRRNYQRVKQRLGLNSGQDTLRAVNSIRNSLTVGQQSKTQRGIRFRTQGEDGERWVPRMLMGDLQIKSKERKIDTRAQDRRMECFLGRYKIDQ